MTLIVRAPPRIDGGVTQLALVVPFTGGGPRDANRARS